MWLFRSSIGRKLIMSVTGVCLILFLTFHALMNAVAIFWPQAYNVVCAFLGANWYALVASIGLAALFIIHIIYALWLTVQNRKARGADRYKVNARQPQVEWSSKNMLVLGFVILAFLGLHLVQFWAKMQLAEIRHSFAVVEGHMAAPAAGTLFLQQVFCNICVVIVYAIAFFALWFLLTHGFWSMFQTRGWDNDIWMKRLKTIGNWWTTIVVGLFLAEAVVFTAMAMCPDKPYLNCPKLIDQYKEMESEFVSAAAEAQAPVDTTTFESWLTIDCAAPCGTSCTGTDCANPCGAASCESAPCAAAACNTPCAACPQGQPCPENCGCGNPACPDCSAAAAAQIETVEATN